MDQKQHAKLLNALAEHDRKESLKKHYNRFALGQYMAALQRTEKYVDRGHDLRLALMNCFCGRLLDRLLKSVGLEITTKEEARFGGFQKLPDIDE